jgi:hypothetical protein
MGRICVQPEAIVGSVHVHSLNEVPSQSAYAGDWPPAEQFRNPQHEAVTVKKVPSWVHAEAGASPQTEPA